MTEAGDGVVESGAIVFVLLFPSQHLRAGLMNGVASRLEGARVKAVDDLEARIIQCVAKQSMVAGFRVSSGKT